MGSADAHTNKKRITGFERVVKKILGRSSYCQAALFAFKNLILSIYKYIIHPFVILVNPLKTTYLRAF